MPRDDNAPLPPPFLAAASARGLGPAVRVLSGGSRLQSMRDKLLTIAVFQAGAVVGFQSEPQPFHFRYDEVEKFTQHLVRRYVNGSYRGTQITCWFGLRDGRGYRVGGESTRSERHIVDDLRELVDPPITRAQLPRMQAALGRGENVDFGAYVMEPGGLYVPGGLLRREKRLGWADVREVVLKGGGVQIMAKGRRLAWATAGTVQVPNLTAFLTLVHAATSG